MEVVSQSASCHGGVSFHPSARFLPSRASRRVPPLTGKATELGQDNWGSLGKTLRTTYMCLCLQEHPTTGP